MIFMDQGGRGPNTPKIDNIISEQPFMDIFDNVLFAYIAGWDTTKGQRQSVTNRILPYQRRISFASSSRQNTQLPQERATGLNFKIFRLFGFCF